MSNQVGAPRSDYCARLKISPPHVEDYVEGTPNQRVKIFDLMILALLEHGAPMTYDAIAERLTSAGVVPMSGDMIQSLQKSWHGMPPVYRDAQGQLGLDLSSFHLKMHLRRIGLQGTDGPPAREPPKFEVEVVPDDVPLTSEELEAAFARRSLTSVSNLRQVAAVLDAFATAMTLDEVAKHLLKFDPRGGKRGVPADIVTGSAPGWTDPYSRARKIRIVSIDHAWIEAEENGLRLRILRDEVQAIRPAKASGR